MILNGMCERCGALLSLNATRSDSKDEHTESESTTDETWCTDRGISMLHYNASKRESDEVSVVCPFCGNWNLISRERHSGGDHTDSLSYRPS